MEPKYPNAFLQELSADLAQNLQIKTRSYHLKKYWMCFVGKDLVSYLIKQKIVPDVQSAVQLGNILLQNNFLHHVCRDHTFKNQKLFYRLIVHQNHGNLSQDPTDSWLNYLNPIYQPQGPRGPFTHQTVPIFAQNSLMTINPSSDIPPNFRQIFQTNPDCHSILLDRYNAITLDNVHPPKWRNPTPQARYSMVAIGAGAGGLVSAVGAAGLGGKSAIVQKLLFGGDCLNTGCVPSKAVIKAASVVKYIRNAAQYGVEITGMKVNFGEIMQRMRRLRAQISYHDSCKRFTDKYGVDVYIGHATFVDRNSIVVNGEILHFDKCSIATGGKPRIIPIRGLETIPYYTSENIFNLTVLPEKMLFLGAGPIGCELAQSFARFGSQVTIVTNGNQFLPREDRDAGKILKESLVQDGISFMFQTSIQLVQLLREQTPTQHPVIKCILSNGEVIQTNCLVQAVGRTPNVNGLNLQKAGIEYTNNGITVNDNLQTTNKNVYAVGDCVTKYQFTHVADSMARIVLKNALFHGKSKFSSLLIPWCTYTDPQIAHVGKYGYQLEQEGVEYRAFVKKNADNDRAIVDGETNGFVKVLCKGKSDQIVGATIVGPHAGDMIGEMAVAIQNGIGLSKIAAVIHPYPTYGEGIKQCGDLFNSGKLTPKVKTLMRMIIKEPQK